MKLVFRCFHYLMIYQKILRCFCYSFFGNKIVLLLTFLTAVVYEVCLFSVVSFSRVGSLPIHEYCWVFLGLYFRWLNFLSLCCFKERSLMFWLKFILFCTSCNVLFSRFFNFFFVFSISAFNSVTAFSQNVMISFINSTECCFSFSYQSFKKVLL